MIIGIIMGIVTTLLSIAAVLILEREDGEPLFDRSHIGGEQLEQAVLAGILVALICIFHTKALWLTIICYGLLLAFSVVLARWWHEEGSDFLEIAPFILLTCVLYNVETSVAEKIAASINSEFIGSVLTTVPLMILIFSIGYFIGEVFLFRSEMEQKGGEI